MYPTDAARRSGRAELFKQMDTQNAGVITLDEWIEYALDHIERKVSKMPKDVLTASAQDVPKDEFVAFIKKAVVKGTPEYKELYYFLIKTFMRVMNKKASLPTCITLTSKFSRPLPLRS